MTIHDNDSEQNVHGSRPGTGAVAWTPDADHMAGSNLQAFLDRWNLPSFDALMERSTTDVEWFTGAVLDFLGIRFSVPPQQAVDLSPGIERPIWCPGGRLNITATCLDQWLESPATTQRPALIAELEDGTHRTLTYGELAADVGRCVNALSALGIVQGDRVGLYMPMTAEIVVALLALARMGAVILPLFSGFGAGAVAQRLTDAGARGLITADGFSRRGSTVALKSLADAALLKAPSVTSVLVLRHAGISVDMQPGRDYWWHDVVPDAAPISAPADTAAEDPLMIIYTSGTTGRPKGAVHTHCGFPVKGAQDMSFGIDVHAGDRIHWVTDMGWMMGPWLVFGATILGATAFVYEGAPDWPGPDRLWAMIERHRLHQVGLSPTLIRSLKSFGDNQLEHKNLSSLKCFASTGEPWNPDPWHWLFERVGGSAVPIINYSGGTEISGGILMDNPLRPIKPAAFGAPCPGLAVDVVNADGQSVRNEVGELVIRTPWIGMTRGFWNDAGDDRYLQTYWGRFARTWVHGDWAMVDDDGHWWIMGRSDDTINVAGKRVGPAEFESVLVSHPAVMEAGAVGVPHPVKGAEVVCFCILTPGSAADNNLRVALSDAVALELGRPLRPGRILFVADLPRTRNAKVMRRVLRAAYLNEDPGDTTSLVNPESMEAIRAASV
ncbi:MAG: AMP-binding protein [bacterium]|nr:AMP-binding protein [bacterium]